jgi:hypothetical protein
VTTSERPIPPREGKLPYRGRRSRRQWPTLRHRLSAYFEGPVFAGLASDFPQLARLYGAPGPRPLGERLRNPALAATLGAVARGGADEFYRGSVAERLLADLRAAGGEGMNIQAAIEAPRLRHDEGQRVMIEDRSPPTSSARSSRWDMKWNTLVPGPASWEGPMQFCACRMAF